MPQTPARDKEERQHVQGGEDRLQRQAGGGHHARGQLVERQQARLRPEHEAVARKQLGVKRVEDGRDVERLVAHTKAVAAGITGGQQHERDGRAHPERGETEAVHGGGLECPRVRSCSVDASFWADVSRGRPGALSRTGFAHIPGIEVPPTCSSLSGSVPHSSRIRRC